MSFPKQRFTFKIIQQVMFFIFYYLLLGYTSYLFYPLSWNESFIIATILSVVGIIAIYVEFIKSNIISRTITEILDVLLWASLMYLFLAIAIAIFNFLIFPIPEFYNRLLLFLIVILFIYGYCNAHHPRITDNTLYLNNLSEEIDIVHISDVHIGSIRRAGLLKKISKKINSINPDLVIISGDLADGSNKIQPNDFWPLRNIKAPVLFTPGNHDYYTGIENLFRACENAGIIILDNQKINFKGLNIYGLSFATNDFSLDIEDNENNLLIYHIPANWDEFIDLGFNVMLSGHTHGGQFYPANLWVKLVFPKLKGLFEKDGNYLNVSDGVGTMGPPLRIGTKAEIGLLKLRKKD